MGRFDTIKQVIDANIRQNGNQGITGGVMNSVLNDIVTATEIELAEFEQSEGVLFKTTPLMLPGFYNINTLKLDLESSDYVYTELEIPLNAHMLCMPFLKSIKGSTGVEFRDGEGVKISSFSNTSEAAGTYIAIPIPKNAKKIIFSYLTEEGAKKQNLPSVPEITWYNNQVVAQLQNNISELKQDINESGLIEIPYSPVSGQYYSLLSQDFVDNTSYFFAEVKVPTMAKSCYMPFLKSDKGGLGVEFRDNKGVKISSFSNTSEAAGTYMEIAVPPGAVTMIFSYVVGSLIPVKFRLYALSDFAKKNDFPKLPIFGGAQLYLSKPTGNILQDNLTIEELYAEYDALVEKFPQWIKRANDLGKDASGVYTIRQYEIRMTNPWYVMGEGSMIGKGTPTNLWKDENFAYKTILINAGTHGDEKAPCWSTMLAIKEIVESNAPWAVFLKSSFIIKVCPCLNPYGFQNRTLANAAGVNINRDTLQFSQPETKAWQSWIDSNISAIAYLDMHGVDYFHPFFEFSNKNSEENKKLYVQMAAQLAAAFYEDWTNYLGKNDYPRPYAVESTYSGTTSDYITEKGIRGFTIETPCDITGNRKLASPNYFTSYSKSNKISVDMLINLIQYLGLYE